MFDLRVPREANYSDLYTRLRRLKEYVKQREEKKGRKTRNVINHVTVCESGGGNVELWVYLSVSRGRPVKHECCVWVVTKFTKFRRDKGIFLKPGHKLSLTISDQTTSYRA